MFKELWRLPVSNTFVAVIAKLQDGEAKFAIHASVSNEPFVELYETEDFEEVCQRFGWLVKNVVAQRWTTEAMEALTPALEGLDASRT